MKPIRPLAVTLLAVALVGAGLGPVAATGLSSAAVAAAPTSEEHSRADVQTRFTSQWASAAQVKTDATGGGAGCTTWSTPQATVDATGVAINYVRWLTGVDPISMDQASYGAATAEAALMMSVNKKLDHSPPLGWTCYRPAGADAASNSNLHLSWSSPQPANPTAADVVEGYMDDAGARNEAAGHRRWLLYPPTTTMGTGNAGSGTAASPFGNAIWVNGAENSSASTPRWSSWPTAGYFPSKLEPKGRWSFSTSVKDADLRSATVTVQSPGGSNVPLTVRTVEPQLGSYLGLQTVVWDLASAVPAVTGAATSMYRVTVSGIKIRGVTQPGYSYEVRLIDASVATAEPPTPVVKRAALVKVAVSAKRYGTKPAVGVAVSKFGAAASGVVDIRIDRSKKVIRRTLNSTGRTRIVLPARTTAGKHRVEVSYRGNATTYASGGARSFTVAKAKPAIALSVPKKLKRKKKFSAVVKVNIRGSSVRPTGKVRIYIGKRIVTTKTLKSAHKGKIRIRMPKQKSKGTRVFRAKYFGNANTGKKTSTKKKTRVY